VVFADADVEAASRFIARRALSTAASTVPPSRKALIHRSLYPPIRDAILAAVDKLKVGDPLDPDTDIGPIRVGTDSPVAGTGFVFVRRCASSCRAHRRGMDLPLCWNPRRFPTSRCSDHFSHLEGFDDPDQAVQELNRTRYGFLLTTFVHSLMVQGTL